MRIIKKREKDDDSYFERYGLDGAYGCDTNDEVGILLLFLIATSDKSDLVSIKIKGDGDIGEGSPEWRVDKSSFINDVEWLLDEFRVRRLDVWRIIMRYMGEKYTITGRASSTAMSVRSFSEKSPSIIPFLSEIEAETYNYHDYDVQIIDTIKNYFKLNQRRAVKSLDKLRKYDDIYSEFMTGIRGNIFTFPDKNAVRIEGYTAEDLHKNYPLSELGAYNYLIYLRENPKAALQDLKDGLPRK